MSDVEFVGNHFTTGRVVLPFHSMNVALSGIGESAFGFPTRNLVEVYGGTGIGKSTFVTSIAARLSKHLGDLEIAYLDLEGQDHNVISNALNMSEYSGRFRWVEITKGRPTDERLLDALLDTMVEEPPCIGILDSVAEISPTAEVEGDIGDANMGRRAFPMAQFTRQVTRALRMMEVPSVMFLINHQYEKMGAIGGAKVYTAPGGVVKENLAKLRMKMSVPWVDYISSGDGKKEGRWPEGWILEGKVEKNRSGVKNEIFQVFVYGGQGVHVGMSSVIDCLAAGLAEVKSGGKVMMDGKDYGTLSKIISTKKDDGDFFVDFRNALKVTDVVKQHDEGEE